jgi:sugar/nucleoside kinase (ribokinase family)
VLVCVGDLVEDIVVWLDRPMATGSDTPARIERCRGGSAANVAAFAVAAGGRSRFIGAIGDDDTGRRVADELAAAGVDVRVQRHGRTGSIVVVVGADGERSFLTDRGACDSLTAVPEEWLDAVTWLHLPTYSLASGPIAAECDRLVDVARRRSASISVDCSSTAVLTSYGIERFVDLMRTMQPDVVFANDDEAHLVGIDVSGTLWSGRIVVKRGPSPVRIYEPGTPDPIEVDVPPVSVVRDSTGAGDAFAAGYIVATQVGASVRDATTAGIALAQRVLSNPGASL